ncbi:hypothetical protein NPA30_09350 [Aurantimonas sp. CSK15Z-1]|nr:hypothetical protein [Aurantimonas sp. CSK15Z-1]
MSRDPTILVLGASGLIGEAVADWLARDGRLVVAAARHFSPAQAARFGAARIAAPLVALAEPELCALLDRTRAKVVVNCIGVLQDSGRGTGEAAHVGFVERLTAAMRAHPGLLIHLSVPGSPGDDRTAFSRTKRVGESIIQRSGVPHLILRPGFVLADAAFGGSALMRALAMLPFALPPSLAARPFAVTSVTTSLAPWHGRRTTGAPAVATSRQPGT